MKKALLFLLGATITALFFGGTSGEEEGVECQCQSVLPADSMLGTRKKKCQCTTMTTHSSKKCHSCRVGHHDYPSD
jgi:hypothetical protein